MLVDRIDPFTVRTTPLALAPVTPARPRFPIESTASSRQSLYL
jgi:hypothetical protein